MLPRLAPLDWMVVVRPDRCVLAEGPASQAEHILQRALDLIEPPHLRLDMRLVQAA
ncbi:hypothetical protein [Cupriavidus sp. CuC1]|uniref:hypothetical protein n=1 Tax=Cupriavidus sp. CuC1 TaxID=3373131 RepID=UPI0037D0AF8C